MLRTTIIALLCAACGSLFAKDKPKQNIAQPDLHPYVKTDKGRAAWSLAGKRVNEARLYEFYQRQADYYMANPDKLPEILPAYPGLDGGQHGHWGKHNQNNHEDGRWNDIEFGEVLTHVTRHGKMSVLKGINLRLGETGQISACFDPMTLQYRAIWTDGFLSFHPFRWGSSRNATIKGTPWFASETAAMPAGGEYLGFERDGERIAFRYKVGGVEVREEPFAVGSGFYRAIRINGSHPATTLHIMPPGTTVEASIIGQTPGARIDAKAGTLHIAAASSESQVMIRLSQPGSKHEVAAATLAERWEIRRPRQRWTEQMKVSGTLGEAREGSSYIVDTIPLPFDNPYKQVMQLTGIGFLPDGDAIVCTLAGDMWRVSGLDADLKEVTWRRFATGFNQPMGIHVDQSGIYTLDRGQIYRLTDSNRDGEVDAYQNYANDFGGYDRSHTHTFGLHRTEDGAFHLTQRESILRTGSDQKTEEVGYGVRNCMGIGGGPDYAWVGPQEGTWTPASSIIEVNRGEFYGLGKGGRGGNIAAALCYIPRGIDNSVGGMLHISSDKWGPFKGQHVGISYGSGLHYLILRDASGPRPQGAVVPMEGEFLAGAMRGAWHPEDGQLYVAGLDGWGDYSAQDGCLHRVRYTGGPVRKPSGFNVHSNGLRIDFSCALDPATAEDAGKVFAQAWNYQYAKRYGSPEFSAKTPASLGHDPITVRSVTLLDGGKALFVEMPAMEPVMQLHLRMHLKDAEGVSFKTDLFASPMYPDAAFEAEGLAEEPAGKLTAITLPTSGSSEDSKAKKTESGEVSEGERRLLLEAAGGLQYVQKTLTAKTNEALALTLKNTDVMPHNMVIVAPGSTRKVGEASFKMLNDPEAGKKHYVPALAEVLFFAPVINPGSEHILHFRAPAEPGDYPYICTFPGHWQAMKGILRVEAK